jgi:diguanylate cyclase (GGDEF)-like protein
MESFGLIACDINGLKDVNDGRGHLAGDKLIRQAASILMRYADCDHVVRMGGDEFLVLLENEDESRIWKIIDEVHQACEKEHFAIAMGYALQKGSTDHFDELLRRADQAMYADKGASHRKKS